MRTKRMKTTRRMMRMRKTRGTRRVMVIGKMKTKMKDEDEDGFLSAH